MVWVNSSWPMALKKSHHKMSKGKAQKSARFLFILNGSLFLLGAFSLFEEGKYIQASVQAAAGIVNLIMLIRTRNRQWQLKGHMAIFLMNVLVCLLAAYDHYTSGKTYLQYVWLLSALLSVVAMVIFYRKQQSRQ